ncbi:MAG TPA: hypothetical protein VFH78_04160 [Candidatus Thermoplasmatota archaeon]|nr:hypothetical protein [Candidatus Thermoplasmatota archaeon]
MRALSLVLVLVLVLAPAATAAPEGDPLCIIFFEPSQDFRLVDVKADLILTQEERENLSARVDADADGFITPAEVAAYENSTTLVVTGAPSEFGDRLLYMDGNLPTQMTVYTKLHNWTGPVEEARRGVVSEHREYHTVPAPDESGHLLTGGLYAPGGQSLAQRRPVIQTIVINAPRGWVVFEVRHAPETGEGGPTPSSPPMAGQRYEQKTVQISAFDIRRQYEVVFAKEGTNPYAATGGGMPGFEVPLLLAALAAMALVARRQARTRP